MENVDSIMEEVWHRTETERAGGTAQLEERPDSPGRVSARSTSEAAAESAYARAKQAALAGANGVPAVFSNPGLALAAVDPPTGGPQRGPSESGERRPAAPVPPEPAGSRRSSLPYPAVP